MDFKIQIQYEPSHHYLGLIDGVMRKITFDQNESLKVPVIGWRNVRFQPVASSDQRILKKEAKSFYFVHSYCACDVDKSHRAAEYCVGNQQIVAMVRKENIIGVQFHPERSGKNGQRFLKQIFN